MTDKKITFRLDAATATAFRRRFSGHGEMAAYLRQAAAIAATGKPAAEAVPTDGPAPDDAQADDAQAGASGDAVNVAKPVAVRLYDRQVAAIGREAARLGMRPSQWIRAVIDHQLAEVVTLPEADYQAVVDATRQVRRHGRNVNMLVRDVKRSIAKQRVPQIDASVLEAATQAVNALDAKFTALHASRRTYWRSRQDG